MTEDYISEFKKKQHQAAEEQNRLQEERRKAHEAEAQKTAFIETNSQKAWSELREYLKEKVKEVNEGETSPLLTWNSPRSDEAMITCKGKAIHVQFNRTNSSLEMSSPRPPSVRKAFLPSVKDGKVIWSEGNTQVTGDWLMKEILNRF